MRVAIVSERRADYSRFRPILSLMKRDRFFDVRLAVTGISLLKSHGQDIRVIKRDGFKIAVVIPMYREGVSDTGAEMTRAYGRVMAGLADFFEKVKPDVVLTGFDIGANFAAAIVGAHMNIPVAHIQGGEVTGSIDESLRHATSKFAHIHFPATRDAAERLRRMGEDPRFIFVMGCPSLDMIRQTPQMKKADVALMLGLDPGRPYVVILQHPVTTEATDAGRQMKETLRAVKSMRLQGVVIYPNNDAGSQAIKKEIENSGLLFVPSMSPDQFINALRYTSALVGNSSSGIHETATLHVPTVNIGTRQQGRMRPANVIDVGYRTDEIRRGIRKALYDKKFLARVRRIKNPYGDGHSARRIVGILKKLDYKKIPIQKRFVDEDPRK
ncbi:MAG: UDP-N-acetylglucosamine 2-epimerase (hydrolyzing) [Candidatus Sungbacteria bacterium]|uniref:UDP-N-acetylglucosamine 2-epimerase (Hydrolyzing) n=1 Tax=Candidatus Sungiibacteriota bacterium TaxID=2750080 RepID=A0A932R2D0_9BACT|nr:UDP-N-acetylglucosamine 2-epimerase (hydrolyzing) [Candidatus Sungbacteria bacterium]